MMIPLRFVAADHRAYAHGIDKQTRAPRRHKRAGQWPLRRSCVLAALRRHAHSSRVQLDDVSVRNTMLGSNLLAVESAAAPKPGELERTRKLLMHEARDVKHCVAAPYREGASPFGWLARRLCVHAHNGQRVEQKRRELHDTGSRSCRNRHARKVDAR